MVVFDELTAGKSIHVDEVVSIGRLEVRLSNKTDRVTLTGSGTLAIHGVETIRNKYSTAMIETGILDFGPE